MTDLQHRNTSYAILKSDNLEPMSSILWSKNYQILNIQGFHNNIFEKCAIVWGPYDNDNLRKDIIHVLNEYNENSAIIKYYGDEVINRLKNDGQEIPLDLIMYCTDFNEYAYIHNGVSFSFKEAKRYWTPKSANDIKIGMVVEYFNNNTWNEKEVVNPETEWEKMYNLLNKYGKLRIPA